MPRLFLEVGFSLAILAAVNGALFRGRAPCPDNHVAGETWYPEGCLKCNCYAENYVCASCGILAFNYNTSECYEEPNSGGQYPDCCLPTVLCVGDPGFDSSKLADPPAVIDPPVAVDPPAAVDPPVEVDPPAEVDPVLTEEGRNSKQNPPADTSP